MLNKYLKLVQTMGLIFLFGTTFSQEGNKLSSKPNKAKTNKATVNSDEKKTTLLYSNETDSLKNEQNYHETPSEYEGILNSRKDKKAE